MTTNVFSINMVEDSALRQVINEVKRKVVDHMKYEIEHNDQSNSFDWIPLYKKILSQNVRIGIDPYNDDIRKKAFEELLSPE